LVDSALSQFPALAACSKSVHPIRAGGGHISELLRLFESGQIDFGLSEVDAALATLLTRFTVDDLREQIQDLFCSHPTLSQVRWDKASTELHAFTHFERQGLLYSLGWPPGYSATPPFDFRTRVSGQIVLCDAKPASGNALDLVRRAIKEIVTQWTARHGLTAVQVLVNYRGTMTQQVVGPALRRGSALAQFAADLDTHDDIPAKLLKLTLGRSRIEVTLASGQSRHVSGGAQGVDALVASLVPTVTKHVVQKAKLSSANGSTPFALVYVHLPGSGAGDVKSKLILPRVFAEVDIAQQADRDIDSLWLGGVILDHRQAGVPTLMCCLRNRATWPRDLTPSTFANSAGGTLAAL
jgi:hypothetical protein